MTSAVFGTSTLVAAVFWPRSNARHAWTLVARRQARPCVTRDIEVEYRQTCLEFQRSRFPDRSPLPFLGWIHQEALHCVPAPLGKQRSRDTTAVPGLCPGCADFWPWSTARHVMESQQPCDLPLIIYRRCCLHPSSVNSVSSPHQNSAVSRYALARCRPRAPRR